MQEKGEVNVDDPKVRAKWRLDPKRITYLASRPPDRPAGLRLLERSVQTFAGRQNFPIETRRKILERKQKNASDFPLSRSLSLPTDFGSRFRTNERKNERTGERRGGGF